MVRALVLPLFAIVAHSVQLGRIAHEQSVRQEDVHANAFIMSGRLFGPNDSWFPESRESLNNINNTFSYPRRGIVNLDDPPKKRWVNVIRLHRAEIIPYFIDWQRVLNNHGEINQHAWAETLRRKIKQEYLDELQGIVQTINSPQVTFTNVLLSQAMYDLGSPMACSEVLAAGEDGTVIHGRNLDYKVVSPLIEITFTKNGEPFIVAPTYLGSIGLHTAMKLHHWSFGQNTRFEPFSAATALANLQGKAELWNTYVRELMEQPLTYNQIVDRLQEVPLTRGMYFIIGGAGPYEGTVLTRASDPKFKKVDKLSAENPHDWYVFQTNDDLGSPPIDGRRDAGIGSMNALSQRSVNPMSILEVMRKPPVYMGSNVVLFMMAPKTGQSCSVLGPMIHNNDTSVDSTRCAMTGWNEAHTNNTNYTSS